MAKCLVVTSPYPNLRGQYSENGSHEGRPAFVRDAQPDASATWVFFSAKFGRGPCWYFGRSLPNAGALSSFCSSLDSAHSPDRAEWPSADITAVRDAEAMDVDSSSCSAQQPLTQGPTVPGVVGNVAVAADAAVEMAPSRPACQELDGLVSDDGCTPSALRWLKDLASSITLKRLAEGFGEGNEEAKRTLDEVNAAYQSQSVSPLILVEPATHIEIGTNAVNITCEAVCFSGETLKYQWLKDGVPLRRAERPRYVLCGPKDIGSYACQISAGTRSVSTRTCEVKLSAAEAEIRARFESPLRRAAEAESTGNVLAAIDLLAQAIKASQDFDVVRGNALCRRAELFNQLGRWQEAFDDASKTVLINGGLARAHAARGMAAVKLDRLAEAVSSWETAELLGGVPEAAKEAEQCRQRLEAFFAERRSTGATSAANGGEEEPKQGPEASWQESGWKGRYTGGSAGSFFGGQSGGQSRGTSSGGYGGAAVSADLQRHLKVLELTLDAKGGLPSAATVRATYRRLALQAHPDKPGGSKTAFQALQDAYEKVIGAVMA